MAMTSDETRIHLWVQHGWSKATDARKEGIRQPERWHAYEHEHQVGLPRWQPHEHQAATGIGVSDVQGKHVNSARIAGGRPE
jgi:hypothetical protein